MAVSSPKRPFQFGLMHVFFLTREISAHFDIPSEKKHHGRYAVFNKSLLPAAFGALLVAMTPSTFAPIVDPDNAALRNMVEQSFQYVAMCKVNNKIAADHGGFNTVQADTTLKDENTARPNNDTLYIDALLDLRHEPMVLEMPAFGSNEVSLVVTGYDHYVNIPLLTTRGEFPSKRIGCSLLRQVI